MDNGHIILGFNINNSEYTTVQCNCMLFAFAGMCTVKESTTGTCSATAKGVLVRNTFWHQCREWWVSVKQGARERKGKKRKVWGHGWGVAYLDKKSAVVSREGCEDVWRSLPSSALLTVTQHLPYSVQTSDRGAQSGKGRRVATSKSLRGVPQPHHQLVARWVLGQPWTST
jgi:hypothetical protein